DLSYFHPQFLLNILLADQSTLSRRLRFIRHAVQFDYRPAAKPYLLQRGENCRQINSATTKFDPAIGMPALIARRHTLHILDVQKEQPIVILPNSTSRIAAALLIVGDIEFKFDVARIGRLHDPIPFIW